MIFKESIYNQITLCAPEINAILTVLQLYFKFKKKRKR